ncbi:major facilitator family protein [Cystoisospora suis]|uniref:Molybdate-anion transporter n=1 Tax=Cystoisospora suis TaxID=483139 RepID=A0A2C6LBG6_9APIC|nr:major facilitator family protein [Cystoisospora suis]
MVDPVWCILVFIALSILIGILVYLRCWSGVRSSSTSSPSSPESLCTSSSLLSPPPPFTNSDSPSVFPHDRTHSLRTATASSLSLSSPSGIPATKDGPSPLSNVSPAKEVSSSFCPTVCPSSSPPPPLTSSYPSSIISVSSHHDITTSCSSSNSPSYLSLSPTHPPHPSSSSLQPRSSFLKSPSSSLSEVSHDDAATYAQFQRSYLIVYLLAQASEWIQGPFMYSFYSSTCHLSLHEVGLLFFVEYASNGLFGCLLGSIADVLGRRNVCFLYCFLCIASCLLTRYSPSIFSLLLLGRLLGGMGLSILETIYEVYMIEVFKQHHFPDQWLHDTLSTYVFSNGLLACFSGFFASFLAKYFTEAVCFDAAAILAALSSLSLFLLSRKSPQQTRGSGENKREEEEEKKKDDDNVSSSHVCISTTDRESNERRLDIISGVPETISQEERRGGGGGEEEEESDKKNENEDREKEGKGEGKKKWMGVTMRSTEEEKKAKAEGGCSIGLRRDSTGERREEGLEERKGEKERGVNGSDEGKVVKVDVVTQLEARCRREEEEEETRRESCVYEGSMATPSRSIRGSLSFHLTSLHHRKNETNKETPAPPTESRHHPISSCFRDSRWTGFIATCTEVYIHLKTSVIFIFYDKPAQQCGLIQIFFEVPMSIFFILWTPALDSRMDHGLIFACFMAAVVLGSEVFHLAIHRLKREDFKVLRDFLLLGSIALFIPSTATLHTPRFLSFCLFEAVCGAYYPCMALLRVKMIPDDKRATVMNLFRLPLNALIILIYGWGADVQFIFLFSLCSLMVMVAALMCFSLETRKTSKDAPSLVV